MEVAQLVEKLSRSLCFSKCCRLIERPGIFQERTHEKIAEGQAAWEKISEYFAAQREFQKANPLPIEEIMHCSGDYPMYILATVSSPKTARRGYPETIDNLDVVEAEKDVLLRFCEQWELEGEGPAWWLSSLWF